MDGTSLALSSVLPGLAVLFVLTAFFFGGRGGYYDTDKYDGNGSAH